MIIFSLRYKHSILIELKNGACHLKEHPQISKFTKFDGYWFKTQRHGTLSMDWRDRRPPIIILSSLILKVYHAFAFNPLTGKFICVF